MGATAVTPLATPGGVTSDASLACRSIDGGDVTARAPIVDELAALIASHGTLYEWAADQPQPRAMRGRAPVYVAALPSNLDTVVVRHAWHGGLLAPITGDRFRRPTRAPHEYEMSLTLRTLGVPTTTVLGYARYDAGLGLCRVDVITRFLPDAFDLGMVAAGLIPEATCDEALDATRALLVRLAACGVIHPDLNVKNVLLTRDPQHRLRALVIDVDVIRLDRARAPQVTMAANIARLSRSMRKWRTHFGCDVTDAMLSAFAREAMASTPSKTAS